MKKALQKVLKDKKGFTLAELLIVVAIIAILVAISVPIFTGQLQKSKENTDKANERAAKVAAINKYLSDGKTGTVNYIYNALEGSISEAGSSVTIEGYNVSEQPNGSSENFKKGKAVVKVTVTDGKATVSWVAGKTS